MEAGAERTAAANDLLGKSAVDMAAVLNTSVEETERLKQEAEDYGMVMSNEAVAASAAFENSLTKLSHTAGGLKNRMVGELLPGITQITDGLADLIAGNEQVSDELKNGVTSVIDTIRTLIPQFAELITSIAGAVLESAPGIIKALADGLLSAISELTPTIARIVTEIISALVGLLPQIVSAGAEINIRSHRGLQDYIGIMDEKNVSDLTMETDSRSRTTNYGLTLYKNVNFSVGDNVQIVFHPFNLNVNTRIIAMSFNPYNRREISIEVGDYRPSISDNLYQMEQKTNEIRKDVGESTAELKTATNSADISVTEKSQRLFRITYNAIQATYAAFCSTVKFVISTAGTLAFILKKNENEVMRYEEYFSEGPHTKTYTYPFTSEVGQNTMSLSVVSVDGAEGKFPKMQTWGYVMGAYLAGDTPWDGYIEAREDEVRFTMRRTVRKSLVRTSDTLLFEVLKSRKFKFSEPIPAFIKRERNRKTLDPPSERYSRTHGVQR